VAGLFEQRPISVRREPVTLVSRRRSPPAYRREWFRHQDDAARLRVGARSCAIKCRTLRRWICL